MTEVVPPLLNAERVARTALAALSAAFHSRDLDSLIEQFSVDPAATYAGSEVGEIATGRQELVGLLSGLLRRPERYRFEFGDVRARGDGSSVWLLAEGHGYESRPYGKEDAFPYRVSGLLSAEPEGWRWVVLSGSEPVAPAT